MVGCHDLEEPDIDPAREARVILQRGSDAVHRRVAHRAHADHGVRIAERDRAEIHGAAGELDLVARRLVLGLERQRARIEVRHAHRHRHESIGPQPRIDDPARAVHRQLRSARRAPAGDEAGDAARAVAALLDLRAVRVEDPVVDVRPRAARRQEYQCLVEADARVAIRQPAQRVLRRDLAGILRVEDDEVVAESMHLREGESHRARIAETARQSCVARISSRLAAMPASRAA